MLKIFWSFWVQKFLFIAAFFACIPGFSDWNYYANEEGVKTIIIDAGHGGLDYGNPGTGRKKIKEKHIALDVAIKVGAYLEKNLSDVKVVYTRKDDTFIPLHERTAIANRNKADLFVSIHCDAFRDVRVFGSSSIVMGKDHGEENMRVATRENSVIFLEEDYEEKYEGFDPSKPETYIALTLYQNAYLNQSINIAQKVQDQFRDRAKRKDRGVKQQPLYVTSRTAMPSVLIELGFLTNHSEEDFLNSEAGKDIMASAIYRAIRDYKEEREALLKKSSNKEENSEELKEPKEEQSETEQKETKKPKEKTKITHEVIKIEEKTGEKIAVDKSKNLAPNGANIRVQIGTSLSAKGTDAALHQGFGNVVEVLEGNLYKHQLGPYFSMTDAREALKQAKAKGYKDAFIVAYQGEKRIATDEAEKLIKQAE